MKNKGVCFFVALLALTGCGKDTLHPDGSIKMKVRSMATKGSVVVTETVESTGFLMDGYTDADYHDKSGVNVTERHYIDGAKASYSGKEWSLSGDATWINGVNIRFWSYPQATLDAITVTEQKEGQDNISFSYDDTDADNDLILAYNSQGVSYKPDGSIQSGSETLDITFYHALAQIRFAVLPIKGEVSAKTGFAVDDFELVDVTIGGLVDAGDCVFTGPSGVDGFAWTATSTSGAYTQTLDADFSSGLPSGWSSVKGSGDKASNTYYVHTGDVLFVVPQTSDSKAYIQITLKRKSDDQTFTRKVAFGGEIWKAGYYYSYNLQASSALNQDIDFDVEVVEWKQYGAEIPLN